MSKKSSRLACLDVHSPLYLRSESSQFCGGDISDIYRLVDRAAGAGFKLLQFTPIQDSGVNPCPYMGISIFSYNPVHLSLSHIPIKIDWSLITSELLQKASSQNLNHVSYRSLYHLKIEVLRQIYTTEQVKINIEDYSRDIIAYALFKSLKEKFRQRWVKWPAAFSDGQVEKIIADHPSLCDEVKFHLFVQDTMMRQWQDLADYAEKIGIKLMLDKPIYPVHDSAEVWANQDLFYLRKNGELRYGSGCDNPRDPFGMQYWGHAVYKFKEHPKKIVDYFERQLSFMGPIAGAIRLDHALALVWKYFIIDPQSKKGRHYPALRYRLLKMLKKSFPEIRFIAEDLGYVSVRNVDTPLLKYDILGTRCLQWFHNSRYSKVSTYPEECIAITANHDLDSLPAWWHKLRQNRKQIFWRQLGEEPAEQFKDQIWEIINLVFESQAIFASVALRDLAFDLRRYNKPGIKNSQNWVFRMDKSLEQVNYKKIGGIIKSSERN